MTAPSDTPRTDEAALGFARILIDRATAETTELVDANFARQLERELAEAKCALSKGTRVPVCPRCNVAFVEDAADEKWVHPFSESGCVHACMGVRFNLTDAPEAPK